MNITVIRYASALAFMTLDIFSGVVKVKCTRRKFISSKMSSGLFKKIGNIVCMLITDILFVSSKYVVGIELDIRIPVYIYIVIMECVSVYENCGDSGLIEILKKSFQRFSNDR